MAGKSVLIVCWCMSFEVGHGVGAGRRTFRGRSSTFERVYDFSMRA
jgi:hypothetical protein